MSDVRFDPYSIEGHYGLDLICRLLFTRNPESVAIYSTDTDVALAIVRRLGWVSGGVYVETPVIARAVNEALGEKVSVIPSGKSVEVALVPYSWQRHDVPPDARYVVVLSRNRYSYRSLRAPRSVRESARAARGWLQQSHDVDRAVGLFTPGFIARWTASILFGARRSDVHFLLGQRAMDRLYSSGLQRQLGYLVVLEGIRRGQA